MNKPILNFSKLFHGDEETLSALLREIAVSSHFSGEVSIFDTEKRLVASSVKSGNSQFIINSININNDFLNDYFENSKSITYKFIYENMLLGFIYIEKVETEKQKLFAITELIKNLLNEITKLKIEKKELLQEILNNYREINLLYKFGLIISSHLDLDYILESVLTETKNIIEADTYSILLFDKKTNDLQLKASLGNICPNSGTIHPDRVLARLIIKTGHSEIANDIKQKQKIDCQCNINSLIGIPLKIQNEPYGVIILTSHKGNHFNARDEKLLSSLAAQVSIAIENIYLDINIWKQKRQLALRKLINEEKENTYKDLIGSSYQIAHLQDNVPPDPIPYLIYGEYGTGKGLFARKIHRESSRKDNPFIPVDCALLTSNPLSHRLLFGAENIYESKKSEDDFSYMELAEGGTLLLQNIDMLPGNLGEKLAEFITPREKDGIKFSKFNVRVVADTSVPLEKKVEKGEFDPKLYKILNSHTISVPPLRERKKDIIGISEYFIRQQSALLGKSIKGLDSKAQEKLLNYNYAFGNVKELRDVIERACILTDSDIITSEYIFLGSPSTTAKFSYNLFNIKFIYNLVKNGFFPHPFVYISSLFVLFIYFFAFIPKNKFGTNPGTFLAWSLWWPFFIFSFFLLARFWCSICPINEYGMFLRKIKHFNLKVPSFIKDNTHYFITIGFLLVMWVEEVFVMKNSAFRTGIIMGVIFSIAALVNILFTRHTYCRYVCPLGWTAGTFSFTSILELRSNPEICANKCTTHDCFKGNEKIEGCPMSLHPQFINDNLLCKLCLRCVRLCPNNSPQLNLRLPGWDIANFTNIGQKASLLILCLLSVPYSIAIYESETFSSYHSVYNFSLIYWILPVIFAIIIWLANLIPHSSAKKDRLQSFLNTLNFYVPLALGGNVALQLEYIPVISKLTITSTVIRIFSFSVLRFLQGTILFLSLFFGIFLMLINLHRQQQKEEKPGRYNFNHQILMFLYCLSFLYFLLH